MNLFKKTLLVSAIALASVSAQAELIDSDWKQVSDGLTVLDTESGLEWLNLDQTNGLGFAQIDAKLDNELAGWRFATRDELTVLFDHGFTTALVGVDGKYYDGVNNPGLSAEIAIFKALTGYTSADRSLGYYWEGSALYQAGTIESWFLMSPEYSYDYSAYSGGDGGVGYWLVSDGGLTISSQNDPSINDVSGSSVPVPASAALLGLGLLGFARRKTK